MHTHRSQAARLLVLTALLSLALGSIAAHPIAGHADPDPTSPIYIELEQDLLLTCQDGAATIPISLQVREYFGTKTDHLDHIGSHGCTYLSDGQGLRKLPGSWAPTRGGELDNNSPTQTISQTVTDGVVQGTIVGFQIWTTLNFGLDKLISEIGPVYMKQFINTKTFQIATKLVAGPCEKVQMYLAPPMYQGSGMWVMHFDHAFDLGSYDGIGGRPHYEWHLLNFMVKGPDPDTNEGVVVPGGPGGPGRDGQIPPIGHMPGCTPQVSASSRSVRPATFAAGKGMSWPR